MLTLVEVFGAQSILPTLSLPLDTTIRVAPIQIRGIDGLGPVKADISSSPFANFSGEFITGLWSGKRNIVMALGLNPDWEEQTVESLRLLLYSYFMPKQRVKLRFHNTHLPVCDIEGYVEDMPTNIFSKDPEIQVSIICPDPDFVSELVDFGGTVIFDGPPDPGEPTEIVYTGTAPTEFFLNLSHNDTTPTYTGRVLIRNESANESLLINSVAVDSTQFVQVKTLRGDKDVRVKSYSTSEWASILQEVTENVDWPRLYPGTNLFSVAADSDGQDWDLECNLRFGGL